MYLVTGGSGFIGSALVRALVERERVPVVNVDKLTYAANPRSLGDLAGVPLYHFEQIDICDADAVRRTFADYQPDAVFHLAAESHVDRSIDAPHDFVRTNVLGTSALLAEARRYWQAMSGPRARTFRFVHVSTDEVFGSLGADGAFSESSSYDPASPYAASKAASDHLVRAWHRTYGFPAIVTHSSNNFGPRQFPEKLIPLAILNALADRPIAVYGRGENVRDWLYVDDHIDALLAIEARGRVGETYAISAGNERRNIDVVLRLCDLVDTLVPRPGGAARRDLIRFVTDRPGHDFRYAIDASKLRAELGWRPARDFEVALTDTVRWYVDNREWWEPLRRGVYGGERIGLGSEP